MVTTIQLNKNVKNALTRLKDSEKQTYEEVIVFLIKLFESMRSERRELLIEGCREMAEENVKITKQFEAIEDLSRWEWNES